MGESGENSKEEKRIEEAFEFLMKYPDASDFVENPQTPEEKRIKILYDFLFSMTKYYRKIERESVSKIQREIKSILKERSKLEEEVNKIDWEIKQKSDKIESLRIDLLKEMNEFKNNYENKTYEQIKKKKEYFDKKRK